MEGTLPEDLVTSIDDAKREGEGDQHPAMNHQGVDEKGNDTAENTPEGKDREKDNDDPVGHREGV